MNRNTTSAGRPGDAKTTPEGTAFPAASRTRTSPPPSWTSRPGRNLATARSPPTPGASFAADGIHTSTLRPQAGRCQGAGGAGP
ncbi:MAG: hypothetical protein HY721_11995 [Planctomycetes bacterium]|nr:hypothetical protein [Planctomycetota bacterium]